MHPRRLVAALGIAVGAFIASSDFAAAQSHDTGTLDKATAEKVFPAKPLYSPYAGRTFPTRPFFGDTHLHTSFSMDAGAFGCRLTPRDAYVFAKGREMTSSTGQRSVTNTRRRSGRISPRSTHQPRRTRY